MVRKASPTSAAIGRYSLGMVTGMKQRIIQNVLGSHKRAVEGEREERKG